MKNKYLIIVIMLLFKTEPHHALSIKEQNKVQGFLNKIQKLPDNALRPIEKEIFMDFFTAIKTFDKLDEESYQKYFKNHYNYIPAIIILSAIKSLNVEVLIPSNFQNKSLPKQTERTDDLKLDCAHVIKMRNDNIISTEIQELFFATILPFCCSFKNT